jgi:hypothetical protein
MEEESEEEAWLVDQLLGVATQHVSVEYYSIPRDGMEGHHYRERAYCYELYHQMKLRFIDLGCQGLLINGELDKSQHKLFKEASIRNAKPDFLVHSPGKREGNHTIIEVKKADSDPAKWCNDIETIAAFMKKGPVKGKMPEYRHGIFLIFGNKAKDQTALTSKSILSVLRKKLKNHDRKREVEVKAFNDEQNREKTGKTRSCPDKVNTWNRNIQIWHHAEVRQPATRIATLGELIG